MSIQSDKVISDISEAMSKSFRKLFPNDCIILHHRPGDFLVQDMVLCEVLCNEECDKEVHEKIQDDFIIGKARSGIYKRKIHQLKEKRLVLHQTTINIFKNHE